jgi:hypothetical protein
MAQTAAQRKRAQRARDRARLGDKEYHDKRIERDEMRAYRASKGPPKPQPQPQLQPIPQPQPIQQPQASKSSTKKQKKTEGTSTTSKSAATGCKRFCTIIQIT